MERRFWCLSFWADGGIGMVTCLSLSWSGICWFVSVAPDSFNHTGALSVCSVSGWVMEKQYSWLSSTSDLLFRRLSHLVVVNVLHAHPVELLAERPQCVCMVKGVCACLSDWNSESGQGWDTLTHSLLNLCKAPAELQLTCSSDVV